MAVVGSKFSFNECADLISEQDYDAALASFKATITKLVEAKVSPKRSEVARQLLHVATAIEETLHNHADTWVKKPGPKPTEASPAACSFCAKREAEVFKLIAGPAVSICDECVSLCNQVIAGEGGDDLLDGADDTGGASEERLCGICMEPRETDELVFLPHAAYMCAGCLADLQAIRDKQGS